MTQWLLVGHTLACKTAIYIKYVCSKVFRADGVQTVTLQPAIGLLLSKLYTYTVFLKCALFLWVVMYACLKQPASFVLLPLCLRSSCCVDVCKHMLQLHRNFLLHHRVAQALHRMASGWFVWSGWSACQICLIVPNSMK